MIVVDNFFEQEYLDRIKDESEWSFVTDYYRWWDVTKPPSNVWEEIIALTVEALNFDPGIGFEYWGNCIPENNSLAWHIDKDEKRAIDKQEAIPSEYSCTFYGCPSHFTGGMLEIPVEDSKSEVERISPKYNRMVVLPKLLEHRVSKVWSGKRFAFSFGCWKEKPYIFNNSDIIETEYLRKSKWGY